MKHGFVRQSVQSLGQSRSPQQIHGVIGVVALMYLEADDLAAVDVENQIQIVMPYAA
jgi:hypothetical protein